jgi:hypothetical protein
MQFQSPIKVRNKSENIRYHKLPDLCETYTLTLYILSTVLGYLLSLDKHRVGYTESMLEEYHLRGVLTGHR